MKKAGIVSTGTELILGKISDSNAAYISRCLSSLNLSVEELVTVPDNEEKIKSTIRRLLKTVDLIIITGGLGPTDDDLTVEILADLFNKNVVIDQEALDKIKQYFAETGREVTESDARLAAVPEDVRILRNGTGLAPAFLIEEKGKIIIALPGVPDEMKGIMAESVLPILTEKISSGKTSKVFNFFGLKESTVNNYIKELESAFNFEWGITTDMGTISVEIREAGTSNINKIKEALQKEFDLYMLLEENKSPVEELVLLLKKNNLTFSSAESCTGGLIGKLITDIPGASSVYKGSVIAYDNQIKIDLLNVPEEILIKNGAVSEEVAFSMAKNIAGIFDTDISVSTSGIAGPEGGTDTKPVGTVCFGLYFMKDTSSFTLTFPGERQHVRYRSALAAIDTARRLLREK